MITKLSLRETSPQYGSDHRFDAAQCKHRPHAGRMSAKAKVLAAAVLVVFALLHLVGGALISRSNGAPAETGGLMHRSD
jgi:hypothetical protein